MSSPLTQSGHISLASTLIACCCFPVTSLTSSVFKHNSVSHHGDRASKAITQETVIFDGAWFLLTRPYLDFLFCGSRVTRRITVYLRQGTRSVIHHNTVAASITWRFVFPFRAGWHFFCLLSLHLIFHDTFFWLDTDYLSRNYSIAYWYGRAD